MTEGRRRIIPRLLNVENWSKLLSRGERWFFVSGTLYRVDDKGTAEIKKEHQNHQFPGASGALFRRALSFPKKRKTLEQTDCVLISGLGRFGNGVQQFIHAASFARALDASKILFFVNPTTKIDADETGQEFSFIPIRGPFRNAHGNAPQTIWRSDFFEAGIRSHSFDADAASSTRTQLQQLYEDLIDHHVAPPETLTIHLRSGDVFGEKPHPGYGQPPLSFYKAVIEAYDWKSVLIVSEDTSNPCLEAVMNLAAEQGLPCSLSGKSLPDATRAISRSTNLVASRGTFVPALLFLSDTPKLVFTFNGEIDKIPGGETHTYVDVNDVSGYFSERVLTSNWTNSAEQRALMLEYPRSNLTTHLEIPSGK